MSKESFKRKIATAVACVMTFTVLALAGCKEEVDSNMRGFSNDTYKKIYLPQGTYIAITENDVTTLHRGVGYKESERGSYAGNDSDMVFEFACNPGPISSSQYTAYSFKPDASKYDVACDCVTSYYQQQ